MSYGSNKSKVTRASYGGSGGMAKRLTMEQAHYTQRDGSDFEEVDA